MWWVAIVEENERRLRSHIRSNLLSRLPKRAKVDRRSLNRVVTQLLDQMLKRLVEEDSTEDLLVFIQTEVTENRELLVHLTERKRPKAIPLRPGVSGWSARQAAKMLNCSHSAVLEARKTDRFAEWSEKRGRRLVWRDGRYHADVENLVTVTLASPEQ